MERIENLGKFRNPNPQIFPKFSVIVGEVAIMLSLSHLAAVSGLHHSIGCLPHGFPSISGLRRNARGLCLKHLRKLRQVWAELTEFNLNRISGCSYYFFYTRSYISG